MGAIGKCANLGAFLALHLVWDLPSIDPKTSNFGHRHAENIICVQYVKYSPREPVSGRLEMCLLLVLVLVWNTLGRDTELE